MEVSESLEKSFAVFPTIARPDTDPFKAAESDDLKFIRLSGDLLANWAKEKGVEIPQEIKENGAIFMDGVYQDHWQILHDNLGLTREQVNKDIACQDAGMVIVRDATSAMVIGASGELNIENGIPSRDLSKEELERRHTETADMLNEIYKNSQVVKYSFIPYKPNNQ